ncbi:MAG TPA: hypothetical protein VK638_52940 [Edaphobacter sp.]|nr:hypothetical protein [Edaphobacter sp.]
MSQSTESTTTRFVASDWKPRTSNTLLGYFTVTMPSGMVVHQLSLHKNETSRWVGMPARDYKAGAETKWVRIIDFDSKESSRIFQTLALQAIDELLQAAGGGR